MTRQAVIVSTARTPIGKAFRGALNLTHGADMAAHAIQHAHQARRHRAGRRRGRRARLRAARGLHGHNVARVAALARRLPVTVAGTTVNRFCSSGLQAVAVAAHASCVEGAPVMVAGGLESITHDAERPQQERPRQ